VAVAPAEAIFNKYAQTPKKEQGRSGVRFGASFGYVPPEWKAGLVYKFNWKKYRKPEGKVEERQSKNAQLLAAPMLLHKWYTAQQQYGAPNRSLHCCRGHFRK
jgi:hypothetical protein